MSLEVAAKYLAAHGRGPDDQLIHMSGKEVAGLQALAKAAGGSLTINPHTGLAEAGFLDDIAPIVIGAGLAYMSGGTSLGAEMFGAETLLGGLSNSAIIGGGMGLAGMALNGGDLGAGLRYGLGGYGGASLAGMAGAGVPAPTPIEAASSTPGGAQAVNTQVASAPVTGAPAVQPAVVTPQGGAIFNTAIPAEGVVPPAATSELSALQTSNIIDAEKAASSSYFDKALGLAKEYPITTAGLAAAPFLLKKPSIPTGTSNPQMIRPHTYTRNAQMPTNMIGARYVPGQDTSERRFFDPYYTAQEPYSAANGGIIALAGGGMPVEQMSNNAMMGVNTMYPMANISTSSYGTPDQMASGGLSNLGSYSDGGRLLRGPGDGVSDSIPAQIGQNQPARLADGEFVVPARIVSELGNGSTEAGAKQLYKMLDRVQQARGKTTGKDKVAKNTNAAKLLPA